MRLVALAAAVWLALAAAAVAAPPLKLRSERRLDDRLVQLQLRSSHVRGPTEVRVLLPEGYTRSRRRYPVLYLLHGALDDYTAWTAKGDAERLTAGLPLIVVMPDSGPGGGYTNWFNGGAGGGPHGRATTSGSCCRSWTSATALPAAAPWRGCRWAAGGR